MKPHRMKKPFVYIFTVMSFLMFPALSPAYSGLAVTVEVVKAMPADTFVSPGLKDLAAEISPVLNFKGFKLIKKSDFPLSINGTSELLLTWGRTMFITLEGFNDGQARLKIKIIKAREKVFATTLLLVDNGSAIIGGPPLKNGAMLIRISGKFIR